MKLKVEKGNKDNRKVHINIKRSERNCQSLFWESSVIRKGVKHAQKSFLLFNS